jgi:hypothetical protein
MGCSYLCKNSDCFGVGNAPYLKAAVLEGGNGFSMAPAANVVHVFGKAELKALGGARSYTGRFETLIQPVHAKVAFDHLADLGIPLGRSPWAGRDTGFASHTQVVVHGHDTVFAALLHGPGGTGRHAPGIFAMETGHEDKRRSWQAADEFRANFDDLAQARPNGQILVGFALDLTSAAADAFAGILK